MDKFSRRRYLRRSLAVGAALTAGCLGDGGPADGSNPTNTPTTTPSGKSETPAPTQTPTPHPDSPGETPTGNGTGEETESPTPTDEPATPQSEALVWSTDLGSAVETTPLVGGDAVYAGTEGGSVVRHALADGTREWVFEAGAPIQDLALAGDAVLAVSGTVELAADQTLQALDADSGTQRWTFSPGNWWLELLATRDGTVYVATADDALGPTGQTLFAVPLAGGDPAWSAEIGDPREAVLTEDGIFVSSTGRLYAFDRADGNKRWHAETPDPVYTTLAAADGVVVQGFQPEDSDLYGLLAGFDPGSGEERWRLDDWTVTSTGAREGDLYVGGAAVAAVETDDGTTRWQTEEHGFVRDDAIDERHLYASSENVRAIDRETGETWWTWSPDPAQGGVQVAGIADGRLYLDAYHDAEPRNQFKFAVGTNAGDGVWAFEDGTQLTDLAVGERVAVVGGANGRLYALQ
jgi:outer membrane protein assembly factor BamB